MPTVLSDDWTRTGQVHADTQGATVKARYEAHFATIKS